MTNFEEKLNKLENLTQNIRRSDISLEEALKNFEEGINLAKGLEKEIDKIEGKIQILMNESSPETANETDLKLFTDADLDNENSNNVVGTRK